MDMASLFGHYLARFKDHHGASTSKEQWSALNAILGCRTDQYGQMALACQACECQSRRYLSCGHRSCNQCQNHCTSQWLERQMRKLLPVEYFMVTFTLPYELRAWAKANPTQIYSLLFKCAVSTLKDFGLNDKALMAELAMTVVLHTHTRKLDYHPHVHIIVPGGGVNQHHNEWKQVRGKYLFNEFNLAAVFRGRMLKAIEQSGLTPQSTPKQWVAHCKHVGKGLPALKYLSRYLYRGVINNKNIIRDDGTFITFRYKDAASGETKTRKLRGEDFIALVLQHTLPKGFRRTRDYGFLHGNAKHLLGIVQWVLKAEVPEQAILKRPAFICSQCHAPMMITGFIRRKIVPG